MPFQTTPGDDAWSRHRLELRNAILTKDPRAFRTWNVIADTMCPPLYARFIKPELQYLKSHDWPAWRGVVRTNWLSHANAIHQAYHVCRFQAETGLPIRDLDFILEFGGGYGEMRRTIDRLGFTGKYVIFDLPEQSALQRYYLSTVGNPATITVRDLEEVRAAIESQPRDSRKLFIATWSLDETPAEARAAWSDLLGDFRAVLIAYQSAFGGVDNTAFFKEWQTHFRGVRWRTIAIPQIKDSFYLFGAG